MPAKNAQSASPSKNASTGAKLPVRTFRLGRIKAAVWENETDQTKFYNVTFARTYLDDAKQYHDTDSFGRDDLPLVAKLADQASGRLFARALSAIKAKARPSSPKAGQVQLQGEQSHRPLRFNTDIHLERYKDLIMPVWHRRSPIG